MNYIYWPIALVVAWAADRMVKQYWGKHGLKIATLIVAVLSLAAGIYSRNVIDLLFGLFMLWSARPTPHQEPSSPSQLPS